MHAGHQISQDLGDDAFGMGAPYDPCSLKLRKKARQRPVLGNGETMG